MRSPFSFMRSRSTVVSAVGFFSSAMGHRGDFQLGNLAQPEITPRKLGMRDRQAGLVHDAGAEPHDVEVERPRAPALAPLAAALALDRSALCQQLLRREGGFEEH